MVPTTRPRHVITETEPVARALADAARRWPEDAQSKSRLIAHLIDEGHRTLTGQAEQASKARQDAIDEAAGALTGCYEPGYLDRLRGEWPA